MKSSLNNLTAKITRRKVWEDYRRAAGKFHYCRYIMGYWGDSDDQTELALDPPIIVRVDCGQQSGIEHENDDMADPYWDVTPVKPVDPRVANLRSCYTDGPSYDLSTGERELQDADQVCIPLPWYLALFVRLRQWLPDRRTP